MTISKYGKLSEIDMSIINTISAIAYLYFFNYDKGLSTILSLYIVI